MGIDVVTRFADFWRQVRISKESRQNPLTWFDVELKGLALIGGMHPV
jgi:hypothetical protein